MALVGASAALIAATYGLVRLAYGLYLPEMQADLTFDAGLAGTISAGASLAYCLGAVTGFAMASRHARALVVAAGLSAGAGATGMAIASHVPLFAGSAVLSSAGAGLASPALVHVIQRNLSAEANPRAQLVANAGTGPGLVGAGLLALAVLPDWRTAWVVAAIVSLAAAAAVLALDRSGQHRLPAPQIIPPTSWLTAHRRVIAAALLMGAGSAAVWNYGRTLLVESGAGASRSVLAWVALGVGGTVVIGTAPWTSRLRPRVGWALSTGVAAAASAALVATSGSAWVALVACIAFGWGYTAGTGALIAWTIEIDPSRAPTGTALLFVLLILGQAGGAAGAGALVAGAGYTPAFVAATAASAAAAFLGLRRTRPRPGRRQGRLPGSRADRRRDPARRTG